MKENSLYPKLLLLLSALLWGSGFIMTERAFLSGWTTFSLLFIKQIIPAIAFLYIANKQHFPWQKNRKLVIHCIIAGSVMWMGFATQTYGQLLTSVEIASIYTGLYTLLTPLLALFIQKKKLPFKIYLACFLAFVSVAVISYDGQTFSFGWGETLLLLCALCYAGHLLLMEDVASFKVLFAVSGLQLLTMSSWSGVSMLVLKESFHVAGLGSVLYLALFCSGGAFLLQNYAQKHVDSATAGVILSFESVFGVIGAILIFHEPFTWQIVLGCLTMLLAIYIMEYRSKEK